MTIVLPTAKQNRNQATRHCIVTETEARTKIKIRWGASAHHMTKLRCWRASKKLTGNLQAKWVCNQPRILIATPNTHQTFPIFHKGWVSHPYPRCLVKLKRRSGRDHDGAKLSCLLSFVLAAASLLLLPCIIFLLTSTAKAGGRFNQIRSDLGLHPSVVQICLSLYIRLDLSAPHRPYQ